MKSKSILLVLVASILFTFTNCSRKATNLSFAFYNVENLFDTKYFPSAHGDRNIQPGKPLSARLGVRLKM